ncbi:hypothetical protein [Actinacidiphila acididurans]|uniref:Lipoprotein n=1 Tax=Actinacidiphila acididurans TaxID=2784346 RepID=A0ABS2TST2_9ACTN|nr:hypothetical protein [Actinacidiphila acididurans]MBM9506395.1 hypothetical protein [Actinacidiphila acididurans]
MTGRICAAPSRLRAQAVWSLLLVGIGATSVSCVDPTDPAQVEPVALLNDSRTAVNVSWCGEDTGCKDHEVLGTVAPRKKSTYRISSYEIVFRLEFGDGSVKFLCRDDAEGTTMRSSAAVSTIGLAYRNCSQG